MCHAPWARHRARHPFFQHHGHPGEGWGEDAMRHGFGDEGFGVRRPLRFLAHKLELNDEQIGKLAKILDELKTERAQAAVDDRRTVSDFADALGGEAFDAAKAVGAGDRRVASATKLRDAVIRALDQIHAMLSPEQRQRLAYLIRSGALGL
jgi:Spy/CpxP family protein refolding chaperone